MTKMMNSELTEKLNRIERALQTLRIPLTDSEYRLHDLIAAALTDGGFSVCHEAKIAPRCRIDFFVDGVGIEVKRGRPDKRRLREQCEKYLMQDQIEALILVLDGAVTLPNAIAGKPVRVVGLNRLWGIALP